MHGIALSLWAMNDGAPVEIDQNSVRLAVQNLPCTPLNQRFERPALRGNWQRPRQRLQSWLTVLLIFTGVSARAVRLLAAESPDLQTTDFQLLSSAESSAEILPTIYAGAPAGLPRLASTVPKAPSYPTVRINGAFQVESYWFGQDLENKLTLGHYDPRFDDALTPAEVAELGNLKDGGGFRRTRLSAAGSVAEDINYMIQMDFGFFGRPTFTDVWAEKSDLLLDGSMRVGQWKQPFSLEVVSSYRYTTFLERSSMFQTFTPFRHVGVGWQRVNPDQSSTIAWSIFRTGNDQFGNDISQRGGYSTAARWTLLPWYSQNESNLSYLHLGTAVWAGSPSDSRYRYASIPEGFVGSFGAAPLGSSKVSVPATSNGTPPFVDTGTLDIRQFANFGLEALWVWRACSLQSELMSSSADRIGGSDLTFWGTYLTASWILTGESRPYDRKLGAYDRIVPYRSWTKHDGGWGAWEIAFRYSHIDLDNRDIQGGVMDNWTNGLNWYMTPYVKFQFNHIYSMLDRPPEGDSNAHIYAMRAQLDF